MTQSIVITPHVVNTINSLPESERLAISGALASEMFLGSSTEAGLTPMQLMIYRIIRDYIMRDSHKLRQAM